MRLTIGIFLATLGVGWVMYLPRDTTSLEIIQVGDSIGAVMSWEGLSEMYHWHLVNARLQTPPRVAAQDSTQAVADTAYLPMIAGDTLLLTFRVRGRDGFNQWSPWIEAGDTIMVVVPIPAPVAPSNLRLDTIRVAQNVARLDTILIQPQDTTIAPGGQVFYAALPAMFRARDTVAFLCDGAALRCAQNVVDTTYQYVAYVDTLTGQLRTLPICDRAPGAVCWGALALPQGLEFRFAFGPQLREGT